MRRTTKLRLPGSPAPIARVRFSYPNLTPIDCVPNQGTGVRRVGRSSDNGQVVASFAADVPRGRKKCQFEGGPPLEPSVKRGQRARVRFGKSGQAGIRPGTRSNAGPGHELAPSGLHTVRLNCEDRSPIGTSLREGLPCLGDAPHDPRQSAESDRRAWRPLVRRASRFAGGPPPEAPLQPAS